MPRLAKSLETLREQVNALAPDRSKRDDGWIGDTAHSKRPSDHNPNKKGVVQAIDITHDPKGGMDSYALAETLRESEDRRIKYVISNGRIFSQATSPWKWRKYSGANPHSKHVHISVEDVASLYDDTAEWDIGAPEAEETEVAESNESPIYTFASNGNGGKLTLWQSALKLIKSKTQWAASGTVVTTALGWLMDWRVLAVIVVGLLAAYIIYERSKKP